MKKNIKNIKALINILQTNSGKVSFMGLFQEAVSSFQREWQMLFRLSKLKPEKFLVVGFTQATVEIVYVHFVGDEVQLLAYDFREIHFDHEKKREVVVEWIKTFIKKNSVVEKDVVLTITDDGSLITHCLTLPVLPKAEVLDAAKWKLKEELDFDLENALIDWCLAREYTDEEGIKKHEYVFVVIEKQTIQKYISFVRQCDLNPIGMGVGSINYADILKHSSEKARTAAILDVDFENSTINIYADNKLIFVRKVPLSEKKLNAAVARGLALEKEKAEVSLETVKKIKNTVGIPLKTDKEKDEAVSSRMMSFLRPFLEALVRELKFSINYFKTTFDMDAPSILYVTGSGSDLKNLEDYLQEQLKIKTERLSLPDVIKFKGAKNSKTYKKDQNKIINALAATLGDFQRTNLLPDEIKAQRGELIQKVMLRLTAFVVSVIFLIILTITELQIHDVNQRTQNAKRHLNLIEGVRVMEESLRIKESLIAEIQKNRVPVEGILRSIGADIPDKIVLEKMIIKQEEHLLLLKGTVFVSEEVAEGVLSGFMQILEATEIFGEARLTSLQNTGGIQEFEIKCDLAY